MAPAKHTEDQAIPCKPVIDMTWQKQNTLYADRLSIVAMRSSRFCVMHQQHVEIGEQKGYLTISQSPHPLCSSNSGADRLELSRLFDTKDSTLTICLYPHISFYVDHGLKITAISSGGVCCGKDLHRALEGVPGC